MKKHIDWNSPIKRKDCLILCAAGCVLTAIVYGGIMLKQYTDNIKDFIGRKIE